MPRKHSPDGGRLVAAVLVTTIVALAAADALTGPQLRVIMFAAVAPLIAARRCSYRGTVLVAAVYTVAQTLVYRVVAPDWSVASTLVAFFAALLIGVCAMSLSRALTEREAVYDRTRMVADAVQRTLLRDLPIDAGALRVAGFYNSAQEGARVGGDIYEAVESPYGLRIVIGDVQGKGMPAIGAAHAVLTSFREAAYHERNLEDVAEHLEAALVRHNDAFSRTGADERFVTALLLEMTAPGEGRVLSCGHIPYYLIRGDRVEERLPPDAGLPLGLGGLTGRPRRAADMAQHADDWMVLCTDGVTEARDATGEFYPLRERLAGWTHLSPADLARTLRADLDAYTGGELRDDAAVLVVRRAEAAQRLAGAPRAVDVPIAAADAADAAEEAQAA
ncbi:PP2C family protein-serine/threonine phosphatase [Streptomyces sp. NPDC050610]|uniref:PP2C family protein-serine/threonine phosphatase n=1 Tax=Streptomyces sp. NPDC050610 TaxID=3157097 RepID=UPI0034222A32